LEKAKARAHILEGLLMALAHFDEVIALIGLPRYRNNPKMGNDRFNLLIYSTCKSDMQFADMPLLSR
jgi:DNA gyrase/topoisomerase IV subunit A